MSPGLIIDIVIAVILLISLIVGAVRGLFKSVISLVIVVAALILSVVFSGFLTGPVTDLVYPAFSDKLEKLVTEPSLHINLGAILSNVTEKKIDDFLDSEIPDDYFDSGIPEDILKIAEQFGFTKENLMGPTREALKKAQEIMKNYLDSQPSGSQLNEADTKAAAEDAVKAAAKSYLRPLVRAGLIVILFLVLLILMKVIESAIDERVKDTGGVRHVNSLGGAVLSLAVCVVVVYLVVYLCSKVGLTNIYSEYVDDSYVLSFLMKFIPKA